MAISEREQLILRELEQQFAVARRRVTLEANVLAVAALAGVGLVFAGLRADNSAVTGVLGAVGFVEIMAAVYAVLRLLRRHLATHLPLLARPLPPQPARPVRAARAVADVAPLHAVPT